MLLLLLCFLLLLLLLFPLGAQVESTGTKQTFADSDEEEAPQKKKAKDCSPCGSSFQADAVLSLTRKNLPKNSVRMLAVLTIKRKHSQDQHGPEI